MVSELELILDDFSAELCSIEQMVASLVTTGTATTSGRARVAGANAAILLLAATFEEFIRQTVKATFTAKAITARGIQDFPARLAANVWRKSLERLARTPFDDVEANGADFRERIEATLKFCLSKDLQANVASSLAHNENNMRPAELTRLFNQIGLSDMCGKVATHPEVIALVGAEAAGTAKVAMEATLEDFFRRRNEIAHAITLNSSVGPTSLTTDIAIFRALAHAIREQCETYSTPPPPPGPARPVPSATPPDTAP